MYRSIILKEWLKLRWFFAACVLAHLALCLRIFFVIGRQMREEHAEMVWYQAIHIHTVMYQDIRFLPLFTGLLLAAAQFMPEILGRRMRIALHLPTGRDRMLLLCLLAGIALYLIATGLGVVGVFVTLRRFFPLEVAFSALPTMAPWLLAGLLAYLGMTIVLLEGETRRRVFLALVFGVLVTMLFHGNGYGWLTPALPYLVWLVVPAMLSVFESARRFQQRGA